MLVSLSGIDGVGKTTIAKAVVKALSANGVSAVYSRPKFRTCKQFEYFHFQASGNPTSFNTEPDATIYFHALIIDWLSHLHDFIVQKKKEVIILDRYVYDVLAQGLHIGANIGEFDWFFEKMPKVSIDIFLRIDPDVCSRRILSRDGEVLRVFETNSNLHRLAGIYDEIRSSENWIPEVIHNESVERTTGLVLAMIDRALLDWHFPNQYCKSSPLAKFCLSCENYDYP